MGSRNNSRFPDTALTSDQLRNGRLGASTDFGLINKRSLAGTTLLNKSSEDKLSFNDLSQFSKPTVIEKTKIHEEEDELKDTMKKTIPVIKVNANAASERQPSQLKNQHINVPKK